MTLCRDCQSLLTGLDFCSQFTGVRTVRIFPDSSMIDRISITSGSSLPETFNKLRITYSEGTVPVPEPPTLCDCVITFWNYPQRDATAAGAEALRAVAG